MTVLNMNTVIRSHVILTVNTYRVLTEAIPLRDTSTLPYWWGMCGKMTQRAMPAVAVLLVVPDRRKVTIQTERDTLVL